MLVAQIVVGVLVFTNKREVQRLSENILNNLWRDRQNHRAFWDTIQQAVSETFSFLLDVFPFFFFKYYSSIDQAISPIYFYLYQVRETVIRSID